MEDIGRSFVYRFTSCLSIVLIASGVMRSTILSRRIAIASCFRVVLVLSTNNSSRAVPETAWAYVAFSYLWASSNDLFACGLNLKTRLWMSVHAAGVGGAIGKV